MRREAFMTPATGAKRAARRRSTYFARTSTSRLTGSPTPLVPRVVSSSVVGMRETREGVVADLDDGEADAVDGDRALLDDVGGELGGERDLDDLPAVARRAGRDRAGAVDVALDDVPAEPARRPPWRARG